MPLVQKIFFYSIATIIFVLVLELVRKKMLSENYSWLWLCIALSLFILINQFQLLKSLSDFLQATPSIILIFFGLIAVLLLILQLYLINSSHSVMIKKLVQKIAILEQTVEKKEA